MESLLKKTPQKQWNWSGQNDGDSIDLGPTE